MKLDNDLKKEISQNFAKGDYIAKKAGVRILIGIFLMLVLSIGIGFGYQKWSINKNREIFKDSITYTEGAASFLADAYHQYTETDHIASKKSIMEYVIMRYPNLDTNTIDNKTLRDFYDDCMKGVN